MNLTSAPSYLLFLALLLPANLLFGQDKPKSGTAYAQVSAREGYQSGYFHHLDSTHLYLATTKAGLNQPDALIQLPTSSVVRVELHKKGSGFTGAFLGMIGGAMTGYLIGSTLAADDYCGYTTTYFLGSPVRIKPIGPCGPTETGGLLAFPGAFLGGVAGYFIGKKKMTFNINGNYNNIRNQEKAIRRFEYRR